MSRAELRRQERSQKKDRKKSGSDSETGGIPGVSDAACTDENKSEAACTDENKQSVCARGGKLDRCKGCGVGAVAQGADRGD